MELQAVILAILLFILFIIFIIGLTYIILKVSTELGYIIEAEQLDFLSWIKKNCILADGEWYYDQEPESMERLLEIYNNQRDE